MANTGPSTRIDKSGLVMTMAGVWFSTVNVPPAPLGFISVVYSPTSVTISYVPGDYNGDGFPDFFDYDEFVQCFESGICPPGTDADFNRDGFVDFFDYDAFVVAFESGC